MLIVSCTATGAPLDDFTFTHDGQSLFDDDSTNVTITEESAANQALIIITLSLCPITAESGGSYSCIASKGLISDSASFNVTVINEPGKNSTHNYKS